MRKMSRLFFPALGFAVCFPSGASFWAAAETNVTVLQNTNNSILNEFSPFTGSIKGDKVRMRISPHSGSSVICELSKGDMLIVTGEKNDFYIVKPQDIVPGYVFKAFVNNGCIEGEKVNVRLSPDICSPVITKLDKGYVLSETGVDSCEKWVQIRLPEECKCYVAKEFIEHKGPISLYDYTEQQKKIAMDLLNKASLFAENELQKPFEQINLEAIYHKINLARSPEFANIKAVTQAVEGALDNVQNSYLQKKEQAKVVESFDKIIPNSQSGNSSLLSRHIKHKKTKLQDEIVKTRETTENGLFNLWIAVQNLKKNEVTIEDFYKSELTTKSRVITGVIEEYPYVVANAPGEFIIKDGSKIVAFLYGTKEDLHAWKGKTVRVTGIARNNNYFAFPAYFVYSIEESAKE